MNTQPDLPTEFRFYRQAGMTAHKALDAARIVVRNGYGKHYPHAAGVSQGWQRESNGARWVESLPAAGLRFVGYADELASLRHTGWYTEDDGLNGESLRGSVLQLPGAGRRARYVAAYEDPCNPGTYRVDVSSYAIHLGDIGADGPNDDSGARDAAYAADGFAERTAESERDWNRAWQAGSQWADLGEQVKALREEALAILAERHAVRGIEAPAICAAVTASVRRILSEIQQARAKRQELRDSVAHAWTSKLYPAFNEGAGEQVITA